MHDSVSAGCIASVISKRRHLILIKKQKNLSFSSDGHNYSRRPATELPSCSHIIFICVCELWLQMSVWVFRCVAILLLYCVFFCFVFFTPVCVCCVVTLETVLIAGGLAAAAHKANGRIWQKQTKNLAVTPCISPSTWISLLSICGKLSFQALLQQAAKNNTEVWRGGVQISVLQWRALWEWQLQSFLFLERLELRLVRFFFFQP